MISGTPYDRIARPWLAIVLLAFIGTGCASSPVALTSREAGGTRIVVLGSSTAAGAGVSRPESAWVNLYARSLQSSGTRIDVVNLAVGGYKTYEVMPLGFVPPRGRPAPAKGHTISDALALDPCAIIVNLPSNDAAGAIPVHEQLANFDTLVHRAATAGVAIWIATPQPRNMADSLRQWQMVLRDSIEARFGDRSIDFWSGLASASGGILPELDSGDGIHLNDRGHRILLERVAQKRIPDSSRCR